MTSQEKAAAALAALGLTMAPRFIPFSASRNKAEARKTLNWEITLERAGKPFLTLDYSAGIAHCPGYAAKAAPQAWRAADYALPPGQVYKGTQSRFRAANERERLSQFREAIAAAECESGRAMRFNAFARSADFEAIPTSQSPRPGYNGGPILPGLAEVFYCVVLDSNVLDYPAFEPWAADLGFDQDSRKGESTYNQCLKQALALRAAIGESGIESLRAAFEDF